MVGDKNLRGAMPRESNFPRRFRYFDLCIQFLRWMPILQCVEHTVCCLFRHANKMFDLVHGVSIDISCSRKV